MSKTQTFQFSLFYALCWIGLLFGNQELLAQKKDSVKKHSIISFLLPNKPIGQIDTLTISGDKLEIGGLRLGKFTYAVYNKRTKESPAQRITLVRIKVESKNFNDKPAYQITQQWEKDSLLHTSYTVVKPTDFSTIYHDIYWKKFGYSSTYNFENKTITYSGKIPDSVKTKNLKNFLDSYDTFNLNGHLDLIILPLLPFKLGRVFKIHFFDPGFGKPVWVYYSILGIQSITASDGNVVPCWILENKSSRGNDYQKFWIAVKTKEILKEEDFLQNNFRYKLQASVSEDE